MDIETLTSMTQERLQVKVAKKKLSIQPFAEHVQQGLTASSKKLSPMFLYDERGSALFEEICDLPEYYLTRAETEVLECHAGEIAAESESIDEMIELGSGSSTKTRLLIEAWLGLRGDLHYIPIDISKSMLVQSAKELLRDYSNLRVTALAADYGTALKAIGHRTKTGKLILFLGSSIGNFEEHEAEDMLNQIRAAMQPNDKLIIGMDLVKSKPILERAYDDSQGVTAEFNLNLLARINRALGGQFDLDNFEHRAVYNEEKQRIEMHLVSQKKHKVYIKKIDESIEFEAGEHIHTENSHKYTPEEINAFAERNGLRLKRTWYDKSKWFSLNMMVPQ